MHRRWNILKYYTCGCVPDKGYKIYVKLTQKVSEDIQCNATEIIKSILPGRLSSKQYSSYVIHLTERKRS
jgi:hypothetical protein